jgi:CubicO group peptidase (beta-lactamase class C family)
MLPTICTWLAASLSVVGAPTQPRDIKLIVDGKPATVAERMAFHKVPGCSIVVVQDFKVQSVTHYGNTGNAKKTPITGKTLFALGQMSETVLHGIALKLIDQGKIQLDTPVKSIIKRVPLQPKAQGLTIRHLLQNKGGFTMPKYMGADPKKPFETLISELTHAPIAFESGAHWARSPENASLLQIALEDATGKSIQDLLKLVVPKGQTRYAKFPPDQTYERFAMGTGEDGAPIPNGGRAYAQIGAAGLWSTASEYAHFLAQLMASQTGKSKTPWSKSSANFAFETIIATELDGTKVENEATTFGIQELDGLMVYSRGGSTLGYYGQAWLNPKKGNLILFLTNRQLCWMFGNELRDAMLPALR